MTSPYLENYERICAAISLRESHFREFKSALEGPDATKTPRSPKAIKKDIGEALVAFANADGGELLIGVEDDGKITGIPHGKPEIKDFLESYKTQVHPQTPLPQPLQSLVEIEGKKVIYFSVEKSSRMVHLTSDGRCLQRRDRETLPVSSEQIRFERQEQISREYDRQFIDGAAVSSLDLEIIGRIGKEIAPGMSIEKLLQLLDLADFGVGSVHLRRAALLLFAKDVHRWHPRSEVRILRVAGKEIKAGKEYNVIKDNITVGSVFALMSQAWEALRPHLVQTKFGPGGIFEEHIMYPEDACREALINAIAHRDYSMEGRGIEVFVYEDRMEVRSPGALLSNVSIDELKKLRGLHQSRNVHIARVLREFGYMREMGEGLRRIYQLMKEYDLVEPDLSSDLESFSIVLHHKSVFSEDAQRWVNSFEKFNLTREEKKAVLLGKDGASFSPKQVRSALDIVDTDAYRAIVEGLQLKGILLRALSKNQVHWRAKKNSISTKMIPSLKVRMPQECESYFAELMRAFQAVEPQERISTSMLKEVLGQLSEDNPYRTDIAILGRAIQLLGLVDQDKRPLGRLRGIWESASESPKSIQPKSQFLAKSEGLEPIITEEEHDELMQDELKQEVINKAIYVGNLSYDANREDLKKLFEGFGPVRSVRIPVDFYTAKSRGFAFVEMESTADAKVAKDTLDGRSFRGRILHLDWDKGEFN